MANRKKITSADTETMESFVLPRGEALNKEISREDIAASLGTRLRSPAHGSLPGSSLQQLNAMRRPGPAEMYSDGRRNYASFEDLKRANPDMPLVSNPPSAEQENRAKAGKAFLESIGAGPFGLGPIVYDLGGGADTVDASVQLDKAVGGLLTGGAARGADRVTLPAPGRMAPLTRKY